MDSLTTRFDGPHADGSASEEDPGQDYTNSAFVHHRIVGALQSLPEQWRAGLRHVEVLGRTEREAAALLGIEAGAVTGTLFHAREGLRGTYEQ